MSDRLDLILEKLEDLTKKVMALEEVKQNVNAIRASQEVTNAKLESMELRLSSVEGQLKELSMEVERINRSADYLAGKAGEHDKDIHLLKEDVNRLRFSNK